MQKHDCKAVLDGINQKLTENYSDADLGIYVCDKYETIRHALRIAERLMQEPSGPVVAVGVIAWKNHPLAVVSQFKAMRDAMLAEIAEDEEE